MENPNFKAQHAFNPDMPSGVEPGGSGMPGMVAPPYPVDPPAYYSNATFPQPPPMHPSITTMYGSSGRVIVQAPNGIQLQPAGLHGPTTSTIIVTQPVSFGPNPVQLICPHCRTNITTKITYHAGTLTHVCCMLTFCFLCWPCACIPYLTDCTKDATHSCPNCQHKVGFFKR